MFRKFDYSVTEASEGCTVSAFLRETGWSHRTLAYVKRLPGGILLNGTGVPASAVLHAGDLLCVCLREDISSPGVTPWPCPLQILYEDEDLLVIDKPAGIPVPPSMGHRDQCMAGAVLSYYKQQNVPFTVRFIGRLDADTSGVLLVGKNMHAASILSEMLRHRQITRLYLGFAEGIISEPCVISAPIARVEGSALMRCVDRARGEEAVTQLSPVCVNGELGLTLVRYRLLTGRTHQIRVHMQHLGHPLTGDFLYPARRDLLTRQALHAACLSFCHPITKEAMQIFAPLPADLRALLPAGISCEVPVLLGMREGTCTD